jgi:hypothetical protein
LFVPFRVILRIVLTGAGKANFKTGHYRRSYLIDLSLIVSLEFKLSLAPAIET